MPDSLLVMNPQQAAIGDRNQADWIARRDAALRRSRRGQNTIKALGYGAGGAMMTLGAAGLLPGQGAASQLGALATGLPASGQVPAGTLAAGVLPTGAAPLASTSLVPLATAGSNMVIPSMVTPAMASSAAGAGGGAGGNILGAIGSWAGRGNNALELGKMGIGGLTSYLQNRSTQNALRDTNAATLTDNAAQRDFLREQYDREHQDYLDAIAEQKRQWDEEQKEKARQWEAMEPWREAGRGNLTRMSSLLDEPRPGRVAYQPTFQYRP